MTDQEALELLKTHNEKCSGCDKLCDDMCKPAVELAISALERQILKKYKKIHPCKSVTYYQCPCCDVLLHANENFCGECGQAIDWSDND